METKEFIYLFNKGSFLDELASLISIRECSLQVWQIAQDVSYASCKYRFLISIQMCAIPGMDHLVVY